MLSLFGAPGVIIGFMQRALSTDLTGTCFHTRVPLVFQMYMEAAVCYMINVTLNL